MLREMLRAKIQRARVTASDLNYEGSITIDETLMEAAGILPYEKVQVLNINTGARAETYVIKGDRDSGEIVMNGAIARLVQVDDPLIILAYHYLEDEQAADVPPKIVLLDDDNRIARVLP